MWALWTWYLLSTIVETANGINAASIETDSSSVKNVTEKAMLGLVFGNGTTVTQGKVYHEPRSMLSIVCVAPLQGYKSHSMEFVQDPLADYAFIERNVSIVNETAIELTWTFNSYEIDIKVLVYCTANPEASTPKRAVLRSEQIYIYVNNGLRSAQQSVTCITPAIPPASSYNSSTMTTCLFKIKPHTKRPSYYNYSLYAGYTRDSRGDLLYMSTAQPMDFRVQVHWDHARICTVTALYLRTELQELFSNRVATFTEEINVVNTIVIPADAVEWISLETGVDAIFVVKWSAPISVCTNWTYSANMSIWLDSEDKATKEPAQHMLIQCKLSITACEQHISNLRPGAKYRAQLVHAVWQSRSPPPVGEPMAQFPREAQAFSFITKELAPQRGPEIEPSYQVGRCVDAHEKCKHISNRTSCRVVKMFWQAVKPNESNGVISKYQAEWYAGEQLVDVVSLPGTARSAEICWDGTKDITLLVAGATSKGFPEQRSTWSRRKIEAVKADDAVVTHIGFTIRKSSTPASRPGCTLSWLIAADAAPTDGVFRILYCRRMMQGAQGCLEHAELTLNRMDVTSSTWLSFMKYSWVADNLSTTICNSSVGLYVADARKRLSGESRAKIFTEAWCILEDDHKAIHGSSLEVTATSRHTDICLQVSPLSSGCRAVGGPAILYTYQLFDDNGNLVASETTSTNISSYCFIGLAEEQSYEAVVQATIDNGARDPFLLRSAPVYKMKWGFSTGEKFGMTLGILFLLSFLATAVAVCCIKGYHYCAVWRKSLKISRIRVSHQLSEHPHYMHESMAKIHGSSFDCGISFPNDVRNENLSGWSDADGSNLTEDKSLLSDSAFCSRSSDDSMSQKSSEKGSPTDGCGGNQVSFLDTKYLVNLHCSDKSAARSDIADAPQPSVTAMRSGVYCGAKQGDDDHSLDYVVVTSLPSGLNDDVRFRCSYADPGSTGRHYASEYLLAPTESEPRAMQQARAGRSTPAAKNLLSHSALELHPASYASSGVCCEASCGVVHTNSATSRGPRAPSVDTLPYLVLDSP